MAPSSIILTNGVVVFELDQITKLKVLTQRLLNFISPYFLPVLSGDPHFRIVLEDIALFPDEWRACTDQPITIRKSSSPIFHLTGRSFIPDDHTLIVLDDATGTGYHIQYATNTITFFGSDASFIHLIELVRYVSLLIEEAHGTLVLHATASIHDDACYLIVGEKGAGKSTTLLHLILDHGHAYFSGDKVLISERGAGLLLRGWPDYPHLGIGTLQRFPVVAETCDLALTQADGTPKPAYQKELIDPRVFHTALPRHPEGQATRAAMLIFPAVSEERITLSVVDAAAKQSCDLLAFVEYPHEFGLVQWHQLFQAIRRTEPGDYTSLLSRMCDIPWIRTTGKGSIDLPG